MADTKIKDSLSAETPAADEKPVKKTAATTKKTAAKKTTKTAAAETEAAVQEEAPKKTRKAPAKKTVKKAAAKEEAPAAADEKKTVKKAPAKKAAAKKTVKAETTSQSEEMVQKEAAKGASIQSDLAETADKRGAAKDKGQQPATLKEEAETGTPAPQTEKMVQQEAAAGAEVQQSVQAAADKKAAKTTKKAVSKKAAEKPASPIVRPEAAVAVKKEMPLSKAETEKEAADKARAAKEAAAAKAPAKEETVMKPLVDLTEEKLNFYNTLSNDVLNDAARALVGMDWNDLKAGLQKAKDVPAYILDVLNEHRDQAAAFDFEKDGFDASALPVFADRIEATLPFKASDSASLAERIEDALKFQYSDDPLANAEGYNRLMDLMREVLMAGQRENITSLEQMKERIPADLHQLLYKFMDTAYALLPSWQYNDVKYYEGFLYGFLSQFNDLSNMHNRAMMDVADLYIRHGDYGKGDAEYNYVIRENNLKDQIYFRFANVYRPIDLQKAKSIAGSALQYVDGRFEYYPRIMEILNS